MTLISLITERLGIILVISLYSSTLYGATYLTPVLKMYLQFSKQTETFLLLSLVLLVLLSLINKLLFSNIAATMQSLMLGSPQLCFKAHRKACIQRKNIPESVTQNGERLCFITSFGSPELGINPKSIGSTEIKSFGNRTLALMVDR